MTTSARIVFVTGTDTGVGKTTVGCALVGAWRRAGRAVAVLKPIETGCTAGPDGLVPVDARRLAEAAGTHAALERLCPNRYALPASPERAAAAAGRPVDLATILAARDVLATHAEVLLVEGAGGLLVPIAPGFLMADLALRLGAKLLVVARASLGTINHTLLTIEAARRRGLVVAGVILNQPQVEAPGSDAAENGEAIARHGAVRVFGILPHRPGASLPDLAEMAQRHLDLEGLWLAL